MVSVQRKKLQSGRRGIRGLNARMGWECCISRGGQVEKWRYTSWRSLRRKSQCYLQKKQGQLRKCELQRVLNLKKESSKHFKWTHFGPGAALY